MSQNSTYQNYRQWLSLADELNDGTSNQLTLDDFDEDFVQAAKHHTEDYPQFPWPPGRSDFDYWYQGDFGFLCPRCLCISGNRSLCTICGVDMTDLVP